MHCTCTGIMVGHVCPEAFCGGNIALIQNEDIITIDPVNKALDVVCFVYHKCIAYTMDAARGDSFVPFIASYSFSVTKLLKALTYHVVGFLHGVLILLFREAKQSHEN